MKRTAFFISDGTGITAEALGNSLLSQFEKICFEHVTLPYVDSKEKAFKAVEKINAAFAKDGCKPIIIDTIVNQEIRKILASAQGFTIDIFSTFLEPLEKELSTDSSYTVGKSHSIVNEPNYKVRIDAVHFALDNDDGARTRQYDAADIIIVGVSRSGKTPTCLYLALQFGIYAANYPLTEEDFEDHTHHLPKTLVPYRNKLFGLSILPERLTAIRQERKPNTRYASLAQCEKEIHLAELLFHKERIPFINSTDYSIEEISTRLLEMTGISRRSH